MSVVLFVSDSSHASSLIPWGIRFAHADHRDLVVVCPKRSKGKTAWQDLDLDEQSENSLHQAIYQTVAGQSWAKLIPPNSEIQRSASTPDESTVLVSVKELVAPEPEIAFCNELENLNASLLLIPADQPSRTFDDDQAWSSHVMLTVHPETVVIRGRPECDQKALSILVATRGESDTEAALLRAVHLCDGDSSNISLLYVAQLSENIADDKTVAIKVATRKMRRMVDAMAVSTHQMTKHVVLDDSLRTAIDNHCQTNEVDIVVVGTRSKRAIKAIFRQDANDQPNYSVAAVREAIPLGRRAWKQLKVWVRDRVPQLDRDGRVSLVERLESSSKFDFDFVALIALSTLIAGLGLLQNSGAVVIGAMLVAPLMTPLVGTGFGLVQGNGRLVRDAMRSVILGFAIAYGLALATGILIPGISAEREMTSRGAPNLLDLVVALLSGVAAAYAQGRPNLISALPGVAIAAALVPPISTSGISLALWFRQLCGFQVSIGPEFAGRPLDLAGGSLLLFATNIFAIILGTAIVFWAVGIDTRADAKTAEGRAQAVWPRYWFIGFFLISLILAAIMTWRNGF